MPSSPPRLSLSDMAVQMENLIHTLIPFKEAEIAKWKQAQVDEVERLRQWYDDHILSLEDELRILHDHGAALGVQIPNPDIVPISDLEDEKRKQELRNAYSARIMTDDERSKVASLIGTESPGINDDPTVAEREIRFIAERNS